MINFRTCSELFSRVVFRRHLLSASHGEMSGFDRFLESNLVRAGILLTVITVPQTIGGAKTGDAIQAALDASKPGDEIDITAGTYSISSTITVPSGVDIKGDPNDATVLNFVLPGPSYGMTLNGGDSNVTIERLNMSSNYGLIGMYYSGSNNTTYTNIHITNNALRFGGGSTTNGTAIFGIYGTVGNDGLQITSNYFHDSPTSVRDWEIWDASNANLDYNTLFNVVDGGHICEPGANVSFSNNYGRKLHRMGQEIQGSSVGHNLQVNNNTFYDWVSPYYDSFGLSVVNHNSLDTIITGNYLSANIVTGSGWGIADGGGANRFGYAIEAGGAYDTSTSTPMKVDKNILVGDWVAGVVSSRLNVEASDNQKYGPANWGDWIGEPSIDGYGSLVLTNNTVDRSVTDAPTMPVIADNPTYQYNPALDGTPPTQSAVITTPGSSNGATGTSTGSTTGGSFTGTTGTGTTGTGTTSTGTGTTGTDGGSTVTTVPQNTGITTTGATAVGTAIEIDPAENTSTVVGNLGALQVTPLSATTALLKWPKPPTEGGVNNQVTSVTQYEVDIESTVGKQHFPSVIYSADLVSATVINLHPGWQIDFTVSAFMSDGTVYRSGPVNSLMSGNSTTTFPGPLWGGISTVKSPGTLN